MAPCLPNRALRALMPAAALAALLALAAAPASARNAYVANSGDGTVTVLNDDTNAVVGSFTLGGEPSGVAITPDGSLALFTNLDGTVSAILTANDQRLGMPIAVGSKPRAIAISPDGARAYVANSGDGTVSVIEIAALRVIAVIKVGAEPEGVAISPDGSRAFVAQRGGDISIINTGSLTVAGVIADPLAPAGLAIGPRGGRGYVTNSSASSVSPFNPAGGPVGAPIGVTGKPLGIAIVPNGQFAYVTSPESNAVTVINTALNSVAGGPLSGFPGAAGIAIDPGGERGYVTDGAGSSVQLLDTVHNVAAGAIAVGAKPVAVAIVPDQPPTAGLFVAPARKLIKRRLTFRAGASHDPDGKIVDYAWDFGDGHHTHGTKTTVFHRYRKPGTYAVTLTVTDEDGCSTEQVFTGQTMSCNGSSVATATEAIVVVNGRGPVLHLAGGRRQRLRGRVDVWAICPKEECAVRARGFVVTKFESNGVSHSHRLWLRRQLASLTPNGWAHLRLRAPKKVRQGVMRALRLGGTAKAQLTVVARDAEGNQTTRQRTVRILPPRRR